MLDDSTKAKEEVSITPGTPPDGAVVAQQLTPTAVKAPPTKAPSAEAGPPKAGVPPIPSGHGRVDYAASAAVVRSSAVVQAPHVPAQQEQLWDSHQEAWYSVTHSGPQQQQQPAAMAEYHRQQQQTTLDRGGWEGWAASQTAAPASPSPYAIMETWGTEELQTPGGKLTAGPSDTYVKQCLMRIVARNHDGRRLDSQSALGMGNGQSGPSTLPIRSLSGT